MDRDKEPRSDLQTVKRSITIQNVISVVVIVGFITGFYFKTSMRLDAAEQRLHEMDVGERYQNEWLGNLSVKTGTPLPTR